MVCPAVVKDPHLGEGDIYYGDEGPDELYGHKERYRGSNDSTSM